MSRSTSDATFDADVLKADRPVLVDFWAPWCSPCRQIAPAIDEIATRMSNRLDVVKIDIDESPETPARFGVRGIPTLMLFMNGQVVATRIGGMPRQALIDWVEDGLNTLAQR